MFAATKLKTELSKLSQALGISFGRVRQDTQNLFEWVHYLNQKALHQEQTIKDLNYQLSSVPKSREEIRNMIDEYYNYENFHKKIEELDGRITSLVGLQKNEIETVKKSLSLIPNNQAILDKVREIEERLGYVEKQKPVSVKERIVKKITRNSKEYVKSVILSLIRKYGKVNGLQLKEIVVDEQGLCSKSSFYRLLAELEDLEEVSVAKSGKEKHYLFKALKHV